jgi:hypothetical protein
VGEENGVGVDEEIVNGSMGVAVGPGLARRKRLQALKPSATTSVSPTMSVLKRFMGFSSLN